MGDYDLRFNRTLYRRHVAGGWRKCAIGCAITGGLLAGAAYMHFRRGWPQWVFVAALLVFLWVFVTSFFGTLADTLDYWKTHVRRRKRR